MHTEKSNVPRIEPCGTPHVSLVDNMSLTLCSYYPTIQQLFQSTVVASLQLTHSSLYLCISLQGGHLKSYAI